MSDQEKKEVTADTVKIDSAKLMIDGVPIKKIGEYAKDIQRYGVKQASYLDTTYVHHVAQEIVYLLAGRKLSAKAAIDVLEKTKEFVMNDAFLYQAE